MDNLYMRLHDTYVKKNKDYGDSFAKSLDKWGRVAYFVRAEDKINRYKTLTENKDKRSVYDETVRDTLEDLLNYTIMLVMESMNIDAFYPDYSKDEGGVPPIKHHFIICEYLSEQDIINGDIFEAYELFSDKNKGKDGYAGLVRQGLWFATIVRDEIYRLEYLQSQTLVSRLKKVKENNLTLIDINKQIEDLTNEMITDVFNEGDCKRLDDYTISHEQLYKAVEIEEWFKKLISDLGELNDTQSGVLVDKVILDYPNDFITHRYKISEGYIWKLVHENS